MKLRELPLASRLDRYVARLFAQSYLAAFCLVVGLFLIIDMATNLDDYLGPDKAGNTPGSLEVGEFYLLQLPFLYLQMSPYVTLVAGMFTAARLARSNEIVAALNAGISVRRMLAPVYVGALLLAVGMFVLRERTTEDLGRRRDLLGDQLKARREAPIVTNLVVRDRKGRPIVLSQYRVSAPGLPPEALGLTSAWREEGLSVAVGADRATPLADGRWQLEGGLRVEVDQRGRHPRSIPVLEEPRFTPQDAELAWKAREHALDLSYGELQDLLLREPSNARFRTLQQYNLTFPLAGLVLLLVGLPFVVGDERGKAGERVARGFFLCVAYFGVDFVARTLGLQGELGPVLAGWFPLLLFGSLGIVLTGHMRS